MPLINRALLEQQTFDSATPAGSAVIVHRMDRAGEYDVHIARDDEVVGVFRLNVGEAPGPEQTVIRSAGSVSAPLEPGSAVALDLAAAMRKPPAERTLAVPAGGWVSFTAPAGAVRRRVLVTPAGDGGEDFDSRRLGPGDVFAVTLIRPGRYAVTNDASGARAEVRVTYPQVGSSPYRPPDPATVDCGANGFSEAAIVLGPAQGLVFQIGAEARIRIELVEPDDGPERAATPRARLTRGERAERPAATDG
jgi:hypothetical protein